MRVQQHEMQRHRCFHANHVRCVLAIQGTAGDCLMHVHACGKMGKGAVVRPDIPDVGAKNRGNVVRFIGNSFRFSRVRLQVLDWRAQ